MKSGILTEELVRKAIALATPSINAILWTKGTTWGPKWVAIAFSGPWLDEPVTAIVGDVEEWKEEWGKPKSFEAIALAKLQTAFGKGDYTGHMVACTPWRLVEGDYLYRGGVFRDGLAASASGAYGETDEGIAEIVLAMVRMLCNLRVRILKEAEINRL